MMRFVPDVLSARRHLLFRGRRNRELPDGHRELGVDEASAGGSPVLRGDLEEAVAGLEAA